MCSQIPRRFAQPTAWPLVRQPLLRAALGLLRLGKLVRLLTKAQAHRWGSGSPGSLQTCHIRHGNRLSSRTGAPALCEQSSSSGGGLFVPKGRGELNKLRCCQDISDWSVGIVELSSPGCKFGGGVKSKGGCFPPLKIM